MTTKILKHEDPMGVAGVVFGKPRNLYFFEVTDVFSGEANYCWVRRYKVRATSMRGAIIMVNKEERFGRLRRVMTGEMYRWDVVGACICIFGQEHDEWDEFEDQRNYKELP